MEALEGGGVQGEEAAAFSGNCLSGNYVLSKIIGMGEGCVIFPGFYNFLVWSISKIRRQRE